MHRAGIFALTLLAIEFLDELIYGAREAAWPLVRTDLGLTYAQIGLLLGLPSLVSSIVEPFLGILADAWRRHVLILVGGAAFALALLLTALSRDYWTLLVSFVLFYPASGAFVSLSQATLVDAEPTRREQSMACWVLAGSLGDFVGPFALGAAAALALGWRGLYLVFAALAVIPLAVAARSLGTSAAPSRSARLDLSSFRTGLAGALQALRRGEVLRWLALMQFADLMMDVMLGYLALCFVDVVGVRPAQAATTVAVRLGVGCWVTC